MDGQAGFDFFEHDFETHLPFPKGNLLLTVFAGLKFATGSAKIFTVGLSDFAEYTQAGDQEFPVVFPFKLRLHPVYELPRDTINLDYKVQLKEVTTGSTLYEVYAWDKPEELDGSEQLIGTIVTDSEITTSLFGD